MKDACGSVMESPEAETESSSEKRTPIERPAMKRAMKGSAAATETAGTGSPPHSSVKCVYQRQYYQRQSRPSQEQESLTAPTGLATSGSTTSSA